MSEKVGRNEPCPCGSGRKYKKCCLGKDEASVSSDHLTQAVDEVREALEGREFASFDEIQAFMRDFNRQRNERPIDDFCGLSAEEMHRFIDFPFESPDLVTFQSCPEGAMSAPVMKLFQMLVEAIGEKGLKPTATGNLPQKFVREAALAYWGEEKCKEYTQYGNIRTEPDFMELNVTRVVAQLTGLIRKYKGKFILSRECRSLMAECGPAGVYLRLLQTYVQKYNWGYTDLYPRIDFLQWSFLYTLYLLHRFGDEWRLSTFYEDAFLRAFPSIVNEVEAMPYSTPEGTLRKAYSLRTLDRFATFFGLVEIQWESDELLARHFKLRKLPLLDEAVVFHVQSREGTDRFPRSSHTDHRR